MCAVLTRVVMISALNDPDVSSKINKLIAAGVLGIGKKDERE